VHRPVVTNVIDTLRKVLEERGKGGGAEESNPLTFGGFYLYFGQSILCIFSMKYTENHQMNQI
jgi:hypothetical protein